MARRFQKIKALDALVAADGDESPEKELIVIGAKWAPFVAEGRLTEISPDSSEEPLPADGSNGLIVETFVPAAGSAVPVTGEAWGTGAPPQKIFLHTLAAPPAKPGSLVFHKTIPAVAATKTFAGELAALTATAVTAGVGGNSIQVTFAAGGAEGVVDGVNLVTVTYVATTSTVSTLVTLINGGGGSALIDAAGVGAVALTVGAAQGPTALANGAAAVTTTIATDNYLGVVSGGSGSTLVTGTVNYTLGTSTITFATAPATGALITVDYLPALSALKLAHNLPYIPVVMKNGLLMAHPAAFVVTDPTTITLVTAANGTDRYTVAFYYPKTPIR